MGLNKKDNKPSPTLKDFLHTLEELHSLVDSSSEEELLKSLMERGIQLIEADFGYLFQVDEKESRLTLQAWTPEALKAWEGESPNQPFPLDKGGIEAECINKKAPVIRYQSEMVTPILEYGRVVALLKLHRKSPPLDWDETELISFLARDIWMLSQKRRAESHLQVCQEKIEQSARFDSLTDLPNRNYILEKIQDEAIRFTRNKRPFSILICDLDHFRAINAHHGYDGGDFALISIAQILKSSIRGQDTVARWGGEEFMLLLPETKMEGAANVAEKLRHKLEFTKLNYKKRTFKLTMTVGVATCTKNPQIEELIKKADQALYLGKTEGCNRVITAGI